MTFAQRRNRITTHFSERIPIIKRRISVFYSSWAHKPSVNQHKAFVGNEVRHVVFTFSAGVNRTVRWVERNAGLYAGEGSVTRGGRCEGVDQEDSVPWIDYRRGLPVDEGMIFFLYIC